MLALNRTAWLPRLGPLADLATSHRMARLAQWVGRPLADRYRGVASIFTAGERRRLLGRAVPPEDAADVHFARTRRLHPLQQMLYYDQKVWLPDDLLVKADKITMAASLELRVPFLDHKVVEWAFRVPPTLKLRGAEGKVLLRRAFADLVPRPILTRAKEGFTIGGGARFRQDVGREAQRMLVDERALRDVLDTDGVTRLVRRHTAAREDLTEPLLALIMLAWWRRLFLGAAT
jgi:asparagine synthase (glutamine-hydrolysing)